MFKQRSIDEIISFTALFFIVSAVLSIPFIIVNKNETKTTLNKRYCYLNYHEKNFDGVAVKQQSDIIKFRKYFSEKDFNGLFKIPDNDSFIMDTIAILAGTEVRVVKSYDELDYSYIKISNPWFNEKSTFNKEFRFGYIPNNQLHKIAPNLPLD